MASFLPIFGLGQSPSLHDRCMDLCVSDTSSVMVVFITCKDDLEQEIEHVENTDFILFPAVIFWKNN